MEKIMVELEKGLMELGRNREKREKWKKIDTFDDDDDKGEEEDGSEGVEGCCCCHVFAHWLTLMALVVWINAKHLSMFQQYKANQVGWAELVKIAFHQKYKIEFKFWLWINYIDMWVGFH